MTFHALSDAQAGIDSRPGAATGRSGASGCRDGAGESRAGQHRVPQRVPHCPGVIKPV